MYYLYPAFAGYMAYIQSNFIITNPFYNDYPAYNDRLARNRLQSI